MPRVSNIEKQRSHQRILEAAAGLIRDKGVETTSVAEVMKAAGLTHGGFYRHFSGKDDLVADAFENAVNVSLAEMERCPGDAARTAYIDMYLSGEHVENRTIGCPIAALGSELARMDGAVRENSSKAVDRVAALLQEDGTELSGYMRFSLLLGAVTLARLADEPDRSQSILSAAKKAITRL